MAGHLKFECVREINLFLSVAEVRFWKRVRMGKGGTLVPTDFL